MDELDSKMKTLVINESNINENNDNKNNNSDTLLKIIEIGSLVIMYLPTIEDILSLFSISNQFNSRMLIPLEILERTIEQLFREKFRNRYDYLERNLVPPFQVDLPSYPCTLKDLKNCHLVIKSIKCCFCLRAMFDSFSKVTSVAIEKESENDPPSYILKISVGTNDRKVCLSITGSFCDGDVDEPVNGDCFTIDAAECSFCETVNCGYCGDYVVCSACKASICGSCDEFVRCSCCNEIVCSNCDPSYVVCEGCNAFFCEDCQYEQSCQQCSYCESSFCEECTDQDANACVQCGGFYCGNCDGDYQICNDCGQCICNICFEDGDSVCCKGCDQYYCDDCYEENTKRCIRCEDYYCNASAEEWNKCRTCKEKSVCNDCRSNKQYCCPVNKKSKKRSNRKKQRKIDDSTAEQKDNNTDDSTAEQKEWNALARKINQAFNS